MHTLDEVFINAVFILKYLRSVCAVRFNRGALHKLDIIELITLRYGPEVLLCGRISIDFFYKKYHEKTIFLITQWSI